MAEKAILTSVDKYIQALNKVGLQVAFAVIFGSQVTGRAHKWSDIDVLVVSPQFDMLADRREIYLLWRIAAQIDNRIEPVPCGVKQWQDDDISAIIEIARREGEILTAA